MPPALAEGLDQQEAAPVLGVRARVCGLRRRPRAGVPDCVGTAYSSERIVDRARRFRREYAGPATSYVRDFDDQLRSALL